MSHPRDPRARRRGDAHPADPLAAAARLELGVGAMRAALTATGPEDVEDDDDGNPDLIEAMREGHRAAVAELAARHLATAVQGGTVAPPISAQEFADALDSIDAVAESAAPAPVESVPPAPPVSAPPAFSAERSRVLDWRSRHDPRSLSYGVPLAGAAPLQELVLPVGPVLDQGTEGACVGFGVVDADNAQTMQFAADRGGKPILLGDADALALFRRADEIDGDGRTGVGTSVLAGMKAGVEAGLFGGYLWAFGTRHIAQTLLQHRTPVVVGVPWLSGMYETGPGGLVQVTGEDTGAGHCLAVVGLKLKGPQGQPGPFFVWQNSWGESYGDGGLGYVHHRDLAGLLRGVGEAAIPTAGPQAPR